MQTILGRLLCSERGEFGEEEAQTDDTATAPEQDAGTGDAQPEDTSSAAPEGVQSDATPDVREDFAAAEESLDPRKLDPALQPIFKRMQGVYTKRMQEIAEIRDRAQEIDRFWNDASFAEQTLRNWAGRNGYQLSRNGQPVAQQQAPQQGGKAPEFLVEAFKKNLQPELQWMAQPQADAMWAAMSGMLEPVLQQQQQQTRQQKEAEWEKHAGALAEVAPGWEEHEEAMGDLFDFLKSDQLFHPTYGSKIQMLYDLATARAASLKQAQARVAAAGKNRVTSGRPVVPAKSSVEDDILKASTKDAWEMAKRAALAKHKSR